MKRAVALSATILLLAACGRPQVALPTEPQTVQGTLFAAGISRTRRGTHELRMEGKLLYYVESRDVDLRKFEQIDVTVTGMLEENTDPKAPAVLVASEIHTQDGGADVPWELPALGVRFDAPKAWLGIIDDAGSVQFSLSGATAPILTVYKDIAEPVLQNAQPVLIQNMQAMRSIDELTGTQTVAIRRAKETLVLLFTPRDIEPDVADALRQQFLRLLRSVQAIGSTSSGASARSTALSSGGQSSAASTASVGSTVFCGGPAGVLCPTGQYCAITDTMAKTGICKPLKK